MINKAHYFGYHYTWGWRYAYCVIRNMQWIIFHGSIRDLDFLAFLCQIVWSNCLITGIETGTGERAIKIFKTWIVEIFLNPDFSFENGTNPSWWWWWRAGAVFSICNLVALHCPPDWSSSPTANTYSTLFAKKTLARDWKRVIETKSQTPSPSSL